MSFSQRTVRRLRLAAPNVEVARHLMPRIEDALRCASLPGDGAQLLLVRRLALGAIGADTSSQALALLIERRMSELGGQWVAGDKPEAAAASFVRFASALDARIALALRLFRGDDCGAWYWPPAVPEYRAGLGARAVLGRIAWTLAKWDHGRTALTAWGAQLVQAGYGPALARAIGEEQGSAIATAVGVRVDVAASVRPRPQQQGGAAARAVGSTGVTSGWLGALLRAGPPAEAAPWAAFSAHGDPLCVDDQWVPTRAREGIGKSPASVIQAEGKSNDAQASLRNWARERVDAIRLGPRSGPSVRDARVPIEVTRFTAGVDKPADREPATSALPPNDATSPYLAPTNAGGLLFLLPVLQRLGIQAWLQGTEPDSGQFVRRVLAAALHRLRVAEDDPAWHLAHGLTDDSAPIAPTPEPSWTSLADEHWRHAVGPRVRALTEAATAAEQAQRWLDAARRWLRLIEGIGLATLALRPARLAVTATHADVHYALASTDIRVRRRGLDIDPGWLPWFGRVVAFHFEREAA